MENWELAYATATVILAYLVGSIPTGYLVAKQLKGIDIREHGSGNVGATNVKRVVGNKAGLFVLICDFLKGLLPVLATRSMFPEAPLVHVLTSLAIIIGHSKSLYLNFTGGKSAISGLGSILALMPWVGVFAGLVAGTTIKITKTVSIGALLACALTPLFLLLPYFVPGLGPVRLPLYPIPYVAYGIISAAYVAWLHRSNIQRLLSGTENKLS